MDLSWLSTLAMGTLALSSPLILAALGGWFSERGGVINIALEGKMLSAAAATAIVAIATDNPWTGLFAGMGAGIAMSLLHWAMTQNYRIDHIVSGMAINALAFGAANYLDKVFTDPNRPKPMPLLPLSAFYVAAILAPILLSAFAARTRAGLRLAAVGSDPAKARQMGVSPVSVRFWGLVGAGAFCGLSGALIVMNAKWFTDGMTAGRGFIALAALILGGWRPIPAMIACVAFGFFQAVQIQFQGSVTFGLKLPPEFWAALPYAITVVALAGLLGRSRAPAGLGKP